MEALIDFEWRIYPASALMAFGAAILFSGIRTEVEGIRRPTGDSIKMVTVIRGFRIAVIGVVLAGLGASWTWHITWPFRSVARFRRRGSLGVVCAPLHTEAEATALATRGAEVTTMIEYTELKSGVADSPVRFEASGALIPAINKLLD